MILTNKLNLPQPFVDAATNDHEYTEGRYSVTELLGGTCEAILKRRHSDELTDDVADMDELDAALARCRERNRERGRL